MDNPKFDELFTPEEVGRHLRISPKTIRDWLRSGKMRGVKAGKLWRIRESDLNAYIEEHSRLDTE